jgi:hypothetical protein
MFFLQDCTGIIDFREYLLGVLIISKASNVAETVELAFKVMYHFGALPQPPLLQFLFYIMKMYNILAVFVIK